MRDLDPETKRRCDEELAARLRKLSEKDIDRACSGIFAWPGVRDYGHKERISKRLSELSADYMAGKPGAWEALNDFCTKAKRGEHIP